MSRILRLFSVFMGLLMFVGAANAAGYTCPSLKKYASCASGYYMTQSTSATDTQCYATPVAGNACKSCPSGYVCSGGTSCPKIVTTVTFDANGGSGGPATATYTYGNTMSNLTSLPTRTGYTFQGYSADPEATSGDMVYPGGGWSMVTWNQNVGQLTLYAIWQAKKYTIGLSPGGANPTGGQSTVTVTYGQPMPTLTGVPSEAGYTFNGYWTSGSGGTQYYYSDGTSARIWDIDQDNYELLGQWKANTCTITLDANGGTGGATSVTATYGQAMPTLSSVPTWAGYTFNGYVVSASGNGTKYYNANGTSASTWDITTCPTTLYASWTPHCADIFLYNHNGGMVDTVNNCTYDGVIESTPVPTRAGYVFKGYYNAQTGGTQYFDANGNATTAMRNWDRSSTLNLYQQWTTCPQVNMYSNYDAATGTLTDNWTLYSSTEICNTTANSTTGISKLDPLPTTAKQEFTFAGVWKTKNGQSGGTRYYWNDGVVAGEGFDTWDRTGDLNLYIQWKPGVENEDRWFRIIWPGQDAGCAVSGTVGVTPQYVKVTTGLAPTENITPPSVNGWEFLGFYMYPYDHVITAAGEQADAYDTSPDNPLNYKIYNADGTPTGKPYPVGTVHGTPCVSGADHGCTPNMYARWAPKDVTVKYNLNGGAGVAPADQTVPFCVGDAITLPSTDITAFYRAGYQMKNWAETSGATTGVSTLGPIKTWPTNGEKTMYAVWSGCPVNTYKPAPTLAIGESTRLSTDQITAGGACSACPTGYDTNGQTAGVRRSSCSINVPAGQYRISSTSATLAACPIGTFINSVNRAAYGKNNRLSCMKCSEQAGPSYTTESTGSTSINQCRKWVPAGRVNGGCDASISDLDNCYGLGNGIYENTGEALDAFNAEFGGNSNVTVECAAGTYKDAHWAYLGTPESCNSCATDTNNNYTLSAAGAGGINQCYLITTQGKYVATSTAAQVTCAAGGYCPGGVQVKYGATGGRSLCSGVDSGYVLATSDAGASNKHQCYINIPQGKYTNGNELLSCGSGKYRNARKLYCESDDATGYCDSFTKDSGNCLTCPAGSYCMTSEEGPQSCLDIPGAIDKIKSDAGATSYTECYVSVPDGYYVSSSGVENCGGGKYRAGTKLYCEGIDSIAECANYADDSASCQTCPGWTYGASTGVGACTACAAIEDGWSRTDGAGWTSYTQCRERKVGFAISEHCVDGEIFREQIAPTPDLGEKENAWGETKVMRAFITGPGAWVDVPNLTCKLCTGATYHPGGENNTGCTTCPGIYNDNLDEGKTTAQQCQVQTTAGRYIATANAGTEAACTRANYCPSELVNYGSTNAPYACPVVPETNYTAMGPAAPTSGYGDNARLTYLSNSYLTGAASKDECSAEAYFTSDWGGWYSYSYWNEGAQKYNNGLDFIAWLQPAAGRYLTTRSGRFYKANNECLAGSYCPGMKQPGTDNTADTYGMLACPDLYPDSAAGAESQNMCYLTTEESSYVPVAEGGLEVCLAGGACPGGVQVFWGQTGGRTECTGATWAIEGASACETCPTIYDDNLDAGKTAQNQCQVKTDWGKYIATANASEQTSCASYHYCPYGTMVSYGDYGADGGLVACPAADAHQRTTFPDEYYVTSAGASTAILDSNVTSTRGWGSVQNCTVLTKIQSSRGELFEYAHYDETTEKYDNTGENYKPLWYKSVPGYYLKTANSTCEGIYAYWAENLECPAGSYCPGREGAKCTGDAPDAEAGRVACSSLTSGEYVNSAKLSTAPEMCYLTTGGGEFVETSGGGLTACTDGGYCPGGVQVFWGQYGTSAGGRMACPDTFPRSAQGSSAMYNCWGYLGAGEYIASYDYDTNTADIQLCAAGTYNPRQSVYWTQANNDEFKCKVCGDNTYSDEAAASCKACGTADGYGNTGDAAAAHAGLASCQVTCPGGSYIDTAESACMPVGVGYWAAASTVSQGELGLRNKCADGLVTIGYGNGADEAGDCGRILHIGDSKLYLRSDKKTDKALHVSVDGKIYYGNMALRGYVTSGQKALHMAPIDSPADTRWLIYDDSMDIEIDSFIPGIE